ncbi:MAG TPA: class I SAM-dependent methyltransferase [Ktedonobacterales bacterium]
MAWWPFRRRGASAANSRASDPTRRSIQGRRFLAGVPYVLPKDMQEINRLDFQHYMLRFALRGNYAAPLANPRDILDVGCGTGRWPFEMAQQFPRANVVGLDLAPPPADDGAAHDTRPANYTFVAGNILEGLPFGDAAFDFTHQRMLTGAIPEDRWQGVVNELARVTRPGGWVELLEAGSAKGGGPALEALNEWGITAAARRGITINMSQRIGEFLLGAGLAQVTFREVPIPLGKYGGRLGTMMEANYFSALENIRPLILAQGLTDSDTHAETLRKARQEAATGRAVVSYFVAYGRRAS